MALSHRALDLLERVSKNLRSDPRGHKALNRLSDYIRTLEEWQTRHRQRRAPSPTRKRTIAASATSELLVALEYTLNNPGCPPDAVASHSWRTMVAGVHITAALEVLGWTQRGEGGVAEVTELGHKVLSDYVHGDRDPIVTSVETLYK